MAYSVNGGRTEYNNWELDGGDNMDNGSNTTLNVYPSLDAIAEVKVLTSNYGAQYGRNGSGTVEVETKSGTNTFHGSAYEFLRNDAFNANNYFNAGNPVPEYKKHDFGYTIGRTALHSRPLQQEATRRSSSGRRSGAGSGRRHRRMRRAFQPHWSVAAISAMSVHQQIRHSTPRRQLTFRTARSQTRAAVTR